MLKHLGERIRQLRKAKGITLVEVAKRTGVAQATLSRIETGTMIGTVESHEKIAEVLGVGLADLYTGLDTRYEQISHVTKEMEKKATHHGKKVTIELLTTESSKKKITPLLISLQENSKTEVETQERGVEKFLYALEGEVVVKVDNAAYTLKPGETLYFDASLPHQIINEKGRGAKLLLTVSPPKI